MSGASALDWVGPAGSIVRVAASFSKAVTVKPVALSSCLLAGVMLSGAARADLSEVLQLDAAAFGVFATDDSVVGETPIPSSPDPSPQSSRSDVVLLLADSFKTFDFISEPKRTDTMVIGAPPSSLGLFLSGLLTIGAWHACRSMGQWHPQAGWMPEWYHSGGPAQVGHAAPFDFHTGLAMVCDFCAGVAVGQDARVFAPPKSLGCSTADAFLLGDPVRGPPAQL